MTLEREGSYLMSMRFEAFLTWPRLTTFETFSFSTSFTDIHWNTLTCKGADLVQMYVGSGRILGKGRFGGRLECCSSPVALLRFERTSFSVFDFNFTKDLISLDKDINPSIKVVGLHKCRLFSFDKLNKFVF